MKGTNLKFDVTPKSFLIVGKGGHAKNLSELLASLGYSIAGYSSKPDSVTDFNNQSNMWSDDFLLASKKVATNVACGIGWPKPLKMKLDLMGRYLDQGYAAPFLAHGQSHVSPTSRIGVGVQLFAGSIALADTEIGPWGVLSAGSILEHGSTLGPNVFIGPGSVVCGDVLVGENTFIGAGVTVLNGIKIGSNCVVGAGSLVLDDLKDGGIYFGTPARSRESK
jgi:sugar O-acyltransferase (sialic acid O-acetyltransferase NeuD family)